MTTKSRSMNCTIPGISLKVFGRAIQSLSKIGDELYFEPSEDGLYLRAVNSCRSAYGCFQFSSKFFVHYVSGSAARGTVNDEDALRCKIGMKSIMTVFRSLGTIDKTVEKCQISLNMIDARLVFQMYCRHGIIKTHNLAFIECETLQAVHSKDLCPNKFTAPPKLLCEAVVNFQNNQEEITLIIRPDYLALKNYVDDEPDTSKVMYTELTLSPNEFENYQVGVDSDVTFCLREMRAVLGFCDLTGLPLTVQFDTPGRPITFSVTSDPSFEANFLLATLAETESSQQSQYQHATQKSQTNINNGKSVTPKNTKVQNGTGPSKSTLSTNPRVSLHQHQPSSYCLPGSSRAMLDDGDDNELSSVMMDISIPEDTLPLSHDPPQSASHAGRNLASGKSLSRRHSLQKEDADEKVSKGDFSRSNHHKFRSLTSQSLEDCGGTSHRLPNAFKEKEIDHTQSLNNQLYKLGESNIQIPNLNRKQLSLKSRCLSDEDVSPVIPLQDTHTLNPESEDENEDEVPGTPPSKKFRAVFFGTQSSTQPTQSQRRVEILAPDSDPE
ncbi:cell cycle checkpoint control protein RAD9B-like [Biomphalaria glabrata]|uniref:Cell cycle checkpoint control protein RAD9A n=2 Tax=Biomphalaria glabrata TaxID=6526 RepID=A0A9W2YG84_BIOGL|nr:cell cycle checkpoint control protein RAD9B-like [Biomphalaria glabrata]